ncbi:Flp family type IVb pilin [Sphingobium bisphenolivorans]|uniref:Flp family type IVb pilin n=1 Tax=Sphingobium bisphenolivorans TaxID=1335760 RepID=UPI00039D347E|nr:Flp family type IVb pilin [Sphingobium bisphenolivorans]
MNFVKRLSRRLIRDERGLSAVEYAVLGAMIVGAIVTVGGNFETQLGAAFTSMFNAIPK